MRVRNVNLPCPFCKRPAQVDCQTMCPLALIAPAIGLPTPVSPSAEDIEVQTKRYPGIPRHAAERLAEYSNSLDWIEHNLPRGVELVAAAMVQLPPREVPALQAILADQETTWGVDGRYIPGRAMRPKEPSVLRVLRVLKQGPITRKVIRERLNLADSVVARSVRRLLAAQLAKQVNGNEYDATETGLASLQNPELVDWGALP